MAYLTTPPAESAGGQLAAMYRSDTEHRGYLPNYARLFGLRPGLYEAWRSLIGEVSANLGARNYELATLAAARAMRSSYCALAHGKVLAEKILDPAAVLAIGTEHEAESLTEADRAMMDFAAKVAVDATAVSEADIAGLRDVGFDETTIFDIASAAAARAFFSKMLDALGAEPDTAFWEMEPSLREALTVGRPIEPVDP